MTDNVTTYTLTGAWSSTNRYTASGETPILISNPGGNRSRVAWAITSDDTEPTPAPGECPVVRGGDGRDITLADTERLWLAAANNAALTASLTV